MSKLLETCGRWGDKMGKLARDKLRAAKTACKCFSCRSMEGNDDAEYGPYPYPEKSMFRDGDLKASTALNTRLLSPQAATPKKLKDSNIDCHNCHNCTGCIGCDNCNDCVACITCQQCNNCHGCANCTNCNNCNGVIDGHNINCVTNSCGKAGNEKAMVKASTALNARLLSPQAVTPKKLKDSNIDCHNCHNCDGCIGCDNCNDCAGCITCQQCNNCHGCVRCTNCNNCYGVVDGHNINCVTNSCGKAGNEKAMVKSKPIPAIGQAPKLKDSNVNCHNCHNCTGCIDCNDCNNCGGCITCNQCNKCNGCITCTNCKNCKGIINGHNRNCVTNSSDTKTQIVAVKSHAKAAIEQAPSLASSARLGKNLSTAIGINTYPANLKDSNINCHNCQNCTGCIDCNNCNGCTGCINCDTCNRCRGCISCTHCNNCVGVIDGHNRNCVTSSSETKTDIGVAKIVKPNANAAIKQASSASSAHLGKKISTSTLLTGIVPHAAPKDSNVNCHNCHNCKGCIDCNDCNGCAGCINCNKCNKCEGCIRCVNCKNCVGVIDGHNRNCVTSSSETKTDIGFVKSNANAAIKQAPSASSAHLGKKISTSTAPATALLTAIVPHAAPKDSNVNCHNCHNCKGCIDCNDCNGCAGCINCNKCNKCEGCIRCVNCKNCIGVIDGHNRNCVTGKAKTGGTVTEIKQRNPDTKATCGNYLIQ